MRNGTSGFCGLGAFMRILSITKWIKKNGRKNRIIAYEQSAEHGIGYMIITIQEC